MSNTSEELQKKMLDEIPEDSLLKTCPQWNPYEHLSQQFETKVKGEQENELTREFNRKTKYD